MSCRSVSYVLNRVMMVTFFLSGLCWARAQQPSPAVEPDGHTLVNKLINEMVGGEKLSTSGTKAELRESRRTKQHGQLWVFYDLFVVGAPPDKTYSLVMWPITDPEPSPSQMGQMEVSIAPTGKVGACSDPSAGDHCGAQVEINLTFQPAKGEPYRLGIISKDGTYRILAMIVPDPIINVDQGCSLEAVRLTPKFEAALIRGNGFKPNEDVDWTSNSEKEIVSGTWKADANGQFVTALLPFVKKKNAGNDQILAKGSNCAPAVSFKWGTKE